MNNYEYIIAGLPVLQSDYRGPLDAQGILQDIEEQLSDKDAASLSFLLDGWKGDNLDEEFYKKAAASHNAFLRDFFLYDLCLRNAKVAYLNKALQRPEGTDIVEGAPEEFEDAARASEVLSQKDILGRERGLDDLLWGKIDELTMMHVFDIDVILGFAAKLQIVDRWLKLDDATGRELFGRFVKEIKDKYDNGNNR